MCLTKEKKCNFVGMVSKQRWQTLPDEWVQICIMPSCIVSNRMRSMSCCIGVQQTGENAAAGTIGGTYATPLVNPPEVAIVALGKVRYLPRFAANGEVEKAALLNISWGADHRILDGATLAEFSNKWKQFIEQPDRLLLRLR